MMRSLIAMGFMGMALLAAGPSRATIIVEHIVPDTDPSWIESGVTFQVQVRLRWDGQSPLLGVFTSTTFNPGVLQFVSSTTAPPTILGFVDNQGTPGDPDDDIVNSGLIRLTTLVQPPGDPPGRLRTIQFGAPARDNFPDPRAATTGAGKLIMTLTFRMIFGGPLDIQGALLSGDVVQGNPVIFVTTPEPGTSVLLALGLTGMAWHRRRRSFGEALVAGGVADGPTPRCVASRGIACPRQQERAERSGGLSRAGRP